MNRQRTTNFLQLAVLVLGLPLTPALCQDPPLETPARPSAYPDPVKHPDSPLALAGD